MLSQVLVCLGTCLLVCLDTCLLVCLDTCGPSRRSARLRRQSGVHRDGDMAHSGTLFSPLPETDARRFLVVRRLASSVQREMPGMTASGGIPSHLLCSPGGAPRLRENGPTDWDSRLGTRGENGPEVEGPGVTSGSPSSMAFNSAKPWSGT